MNQHFAITLSTDQRSTDKSTLSVVRITELKDPDENPYDIPLHGPTKVTVDNQGKASFEVWFDGEPGLVEGRRWPIPFKLKSNRRTVTNTTAHVNCVEAREA
jgi:hypothetical protein